VAFALVRDGSGTAQVTLKKGTTDPALFALFTDLPRESVISVEGTVQKSGKANRGVEVLPSKVDVIARAEVPLPLGVVDRVGAELNTRLDHRVLDLRKPAMRAVFEMRTVLLLELREAFLRRDFLEIATPKLLRQGAEGGATLFPVEYFDRQAYLAQSPQLYKQMLIGAGFERVFEIAPAFRAEPSDTIRHVTEFSSLDGEIGFIDSVEDVREVLEGVVTDSFGATKKELLVRGNALAERIPEPTTPFPRILFSQAMEWLGRPGSESDLGTEDEKALGEIVAKKLGAPLYFITEFPTAIKTGTFYAQRQDSNPRLTYYFDLDFQGLEIASGGAREHRLDHLRRNIETAGLDPEKFAGYLEAFRFGMPPHGGWGLGVDRLVQVLAGLSNIREAILFPRDRYRLDP